MHKVLHIENFSNFSGGKFPNFCERAALANGGMQCHSGYQGSPATGHSLRVDRIGNRHIRHEGKLQSPTRPCLEEALGCSSWKAKGRCNREASILTTMVAGGGGCVLGSHTR